MNVRWSEQKERVNASCFFVDDFIPPARVLLRPSNLWVLYWFCYFVCMRWRERDSLLIEHDIYSGSWHWCDVTEWHWITQPMQSLIYNSKASRILWIVHGVAGVVFCEKWVHVSAHCKLWKANDNRTWGSDLEYNFSFIIFRAHSANVGRIRVVKGKMITKNECGRLIDAPDHQPSGIWPFWPFIGSRHCPGRLIHHSNVVQSLFESLITLLLGRNVFFFILTD